MTDRADSSTPAATTPTTVVATWRGGRRYDIARSGGPATTIDGAGVDGTGPVDTLLGALAACSAIDVEDYLQKRRTPAERITITVTAQRRATPPRRIMSVRLAFVIDGATVEPAHAVRAIALSLERYCSVTASLAADIAIATTVVVNGGLALPVITGTAREDQ